MSAIRVLRVYHSAVVAGYRERERWLRDKHAYDLELVTVPAWPEGGRRVGAEAVDGVPLHVVPRHGHASHPILFWYDVGALRGLLRQFRPDVVDIHEEPYSLAAAATLTAVRRECPGAAVCMYTAQNVDKRYPPPFRQLELRSLRAAQCVYPCSEAAAGVVRRKGYLGSVHVLPLGVAIPDRLAGLRPGVPFRVGFVGRLVPLKGTHIALEAFSRVADRTDATFEIIGSGPELERLQRLAQELGIEHRVAFVGVLPQDETLRRLAEFDVVLIPSLAGRRQVEQFGRVAAEALAAGTCVIASRVGGLVEVLGGCGELVAPGDPDELAARLMSLLDSPQRRAELVAVGRRRVADELSWECVSDGMDRMYREALARV